MFQFVKGDVLKVEADITCHQVNCQGVMGAGLAKQVADQYPIVKKKYQELCSQKSPRELLGTFQLVQVAENRAIANIFGQMFYGNDGKLYTNYEAFRSALKSLADQHPGKSVALPYGIGCGLAGGDWNTVYNIIKEVFADDRKVFICKKERSDDMTNIKTKTSETKGVESNNIPRAIDYEGGEVLIPKRRCKISSIQTNAANLEAVLKGLKPKTAYLGKVVFPGTLFTLEIPILWNSDHRFPYALLAGESKEGFCNLKITSPTEEEEYNGVKAIFDLKTAAVMAFCRYTGLTSPKREKGGGSCSSCKHRRYVEVDGEHREVCALDGSLIDSSWKKFNKEMEVKDRGLMGKKEHDTFTYEHAIESPIEGAKDGRYKYKSTFKSIYTDDSVNCPYYAAWFHHAETNKWITGYSRELPWDGAKIIGSEVIVDVSDFLDPKEIHEEEVDKALEKIGINRNVLKLIATHNELGDSEDEIGEVLESVAKCKIKEETKSLLVKEILHMKNK